MNKTCGNCANYDRKIGFAQICTKCIYDQYENDEPSEWKPGKHFTNADAIRAMSDEKLAKVISPHVAVRFACNCRKDWSEEILNWLKQPFEGE